MQYQVISFALIVLAFLLFLIIEKKISLLTIIAIFVFVTIYGYFFNTSTEKIIRSNFLLKKAKASLKELTDNLEEKVKEQTKDIVEKNKSLEQQARQLEQDKKKLIILDQAKDEFLMMATHELTTPITAIRGKLAMAIEENMAHLNDEQKEYFAPALDSTNRLNHISQELVDAALINQNKFVINAQNDNLHALITEIVKQYQDEAKTKGNKLVYKDNYQAENIFFDKKRIKEVVSNLIANAIHFTKKGDICITSKLSDDKKYLQISVSDTGEGIDSAAQKNLFDKFSQVNRFDPLSPQEQQGAGLGLYISKEIIELHHGKTWLESEKNKGSTFYFTLPLKNKETENISQTKEINLSTQNLAASQLSS